MRAALSVFLKDLRLEGRSKDVLSTTLFFAGLVVLIMGFAFGPDTAKMRDAAAGVLWCALAFASVLAANRAWAGEQESGALESLLLYPVAHEWLYLGKAAANALLMLVLGAVTAALTAIFFDVHFASLGLLALTLALPIGIPSLSQVLADSSAVNAHGGSVRHRAHAAKPIILDRVSSLTGSRLSRVDVRITGIRVAERPRVQ